MKLPSLSFSLDPLATVFLLPIPIFGLVMLLSTDQRLFFSQVINMILGLGILWLITRVDLDFFRKIAPIGYIVTILLIIFVFIFGEITRGSSRWIEIGFFRMQPSEFAKPMLLIFFSWFLTKYDVRKLGPVLASVVLVLVPFILIFKEPDLGSALVVAALFVAMISVSRIKIRYLIILGLIVAALLPVGWHMIHDYQRERIITFLNPNYDPLGRSYNTNQAMIAVGSGQLFGRGLGQGTQTHLKFLPEHTTDFIFASLGEELGFVGSVTLVCLYSLLVWRMISLSERLTDQFARYIVYGTSVIFFFQAMVHIGGNIGILPVTGITLPFISYGGSSVIAMSALLGLAFRALQEAKITHND